MLAVKLYVDIFCNIAKFQQNWLSEIFIFVNNMDINNFTSCHKDIKFLYLLITIKLPFFYFTIILLLLFKALFVQEFITMPKMGNLFFSRHQNVFICCYRCFISLITLFFCEICEYSCTIPNSRGSDKCISNS